MIKRIVLIAILAVLLGCCFIGIKKHHAQSNTEKKFTFWSIQLNEAYKEKMENIISNFKKTHPDYTFVWVDIPIQEAQKRTLASILSSTPPDLINLNADFSQILVQKNALEYFSEKDAKDFLPALVNKLRHNGKIFALPYNATSPVTIYNKEIWQECTHQPFIKTYDELYFISDRLKVCSGIPSYTANLNENDTLLKILNKYDITNFKTQEEKASLINIYSMFNEMYKKDYMPKDTLTINHREMVEKYMSNQALVIVPGSNFIKIIKSDAPDIYKKSAIAPQLVGKNGKYDVSLMNLIIPKKAQNKKLALEFALLLTNKENQLDLSKTTNVLSVNKYALQDDYFKNCSSDLEEQARCESAKQLSNLVENKVQIANKKALTDLLNKTLEEILLNENSCLDTIKARIEHYFPHLNSLIEQN